MDIRYIIQGGIPLNGEVHIDGSKNAALPLIAATVIYPGVSVLHNVPNLSDTRHLLSILEFLGAKTVYEHNTATIDNTNLVNKEIPAELVNKLRGCIVLLGPLLARFGSVQMAYPGGCVLGKRSVEAHIVALTQLGAIDKSTSEILHLEGSLKPSRVVLPEFSVTATENALLAAAITPGTSTIEMSAAEPHVQDVCHFLQTMGVQIEGIGTHTITVHGTTTLQAPVHAVTSDYLEIGLFAIAALVTKGNITIHNVIESHITSFLQVLQKAGAVFTYNDAAHTLTVDGAASDLHAIKLQTMIFPGFPTDLQAPMGVLMTQAKGVSRIFEVLFEGRLAYLYELEKMGAHIEILNAHQALVLGPTALKPRTIASHDIRAGAAMVLAALCTKGESTVTDIHYLERGYSNLDEKLRSLGAVIERKTL